MAVIKFKEWTVSQERDRIIRRLLDEEPMTYEDRYGNIKEVFSKEKILAIIYSNGILTTNEHTTN